MLRGSQSGCGQRRRDPTDLQPQAPAALRGSGHPGFELHRLHRLPGQGLGHLGVWVGARGHAGPRFPPWAPHSRPRATLPLRGGRPVHGPLRTPPDSKPELAPWRPMDNWVGGHGSKIRAILRKKPRHGRCSSDQSCGPLFFRLCVLSRAPPPRLTAVVPRTYARPALALCQQRRLVLQQSFVISVCSGDRLAVRRASRFPRSLSR